MGLGEEIRSETNCLKRYRSRSLVILRIERRRIHSGHFDHKPTISAIREKYEQITQKLSSLFETVPTKTKMRLFDQLSLSSRLEIKRGYWIGNRNVDIWIPRLAGLSYSTKRFRGLVIEVDGKINNTYLKMMKDESKYQFLHRLGIGLLTIENGDVNHPMVRSTIQSLRQAPRLDHRAISRLRRQVWIHTILWHGDDVDILDLYPTYEQELSTQAFLKRLPKFIALPEWQK